MILINATVQIDPVQSRAFTTERADSGFSSQAMTVTGYTDRDRTNLAAAKETARQLNEMASNYHSRIVHVADSEDSQYDGLYELAGATVTATPTTSNSTAALFAVSVTLRRLGGGGTNGANVTYRVSTVASLNVNSYSIASEPVVPVPVGAYPLLTYSDGFYLRQTEDGIANGVLLGGSPPFAYAMSGADVDKGECKLWDALNINNPDTSWARVWSADHTFTADNLMVLDNGMVRVGCTSTDGHHYVQTWDPTGAAWVNVLLSGSGGDSVTIGGSSSHTTQQVTIDELSPWRVSVTWTYSVTAVPYLWSKTITVERGKALAKIVYTPVAAATITMRPMTTRFTLTRRLVDTFSGYDSSVQSSATLSLATDNWLAGFNATTDTVLSVAAVASTSVAASVVSSVLRLTATTATSLTVWVGGVPYSCAKAHIEAESTTLTGGATTTGALSADSGGLVAQLDALNETANAGTLASPPTGSRVVAWFRIASSVASASGNAGDQLKLAIYNTTVPGDATFSLLAANNGAAFAAANTLVWLAIEYTSWNGTDVISPYAVKAASATAQAFYVDEIIMLSVNTQQLTQARDAAALALTDSYVWSTIDRRVW